MHRLAVLTAFVLVLGGIGCDSDQVTRTDDPGNDSLMSDLFAVVGAEDAFANIEDATLEKEMTMSPVFSTPQSFRRHEDHPGHPGGHVGLILMRLGLDSDQRQALWAAMMEHRESIRDLLQELREANAGLIAEANAERRSIIDAYQIGEITREEAIQQLRELCERTREAIRNNPANEPILQALCDSKLALFDNIRSILTEEQRRLWDEWVAGLEGRCFSD